MFQQSELNNLKHSLRKSTKTYIASFPIKRKTSETQQCKSKKSLLTITAFLILIYFSIHYVMEYSKATGRREMQP